MTIKRERKKKFLKEITPLLKKLNKGWFPPDKKTPDGIHYYACSYCDQNCGEHDRHDSDCLYQAAKNTLEKWNSIDNDPKYDKSPLKNTVRTKADAKSMRDFHKARAILDLFFTPLMHRLVPFDYNEPGSEGVVCDCRVYSKSLLKRSHAKGCIHQSLAKIFSDYYKP